MENIKKNTLNKEIVRFEEPSFHRLPKPLPCSYATRGAEEAMFTGRESEISLDDDTNDGV